MNTGILYWAQSITELKTSYTEELNMTLPHQLF